jgi:hypothetical protein
MGTAVAVAQAASDPVPLIVIGLATVFVNCALSTCPGKQSTGPLAGGWTEPLQQAVNPGGVVCADVWVLDTRPAVKTAVIAIALPTRWFIVLSFSSDKELIFHSIESQW